MLKNYYCYIVILLMLVLLASGTVAMEDISKPDVSGCDCAKQTQPPSGKSPILVVTDSHYTANPFGCYLTEILRGEGLVEFEQVERSALDKATDTQLAAYKTIILSEMELNDAEKDLLQRYVHDGGVLIAMKPDAGLGNLFGIRVDGKRKEKLLQYFAVANDLPGVMPRGMGIVQQSLQYHGEANDYTMVGSKPLAFLFDDAETPSSNPAVTLNKFGKGSAVAFAFDLAKSIVLMRQGNPEWQNTEGDGISQYRPTDMFLRLDGKKYFDPNRIKIPQADESQRLLANIIMTLSHNPLPRMWYLPKMHKTMMVNTGDAENMYGDQLDKPFDDCAKYGGYYSVYLRSADGEYPRGIERTSVEKEAAWRAAGHEVGVHVWGRRKEAAGAVEALDKAYGQIVGDLKKKFGHGSRTARNHTADWTGWVDMAAIEAKHGTGMDLNYYHYFLYDGPTKTYGHFTGSGLPQKFIDAEGRILPIYNQSTQWSDEYFADTDTPLDEAVEVMKKMLKDAQNGYYSAYVANAHPPRYCTAVGHAGSKDKTTPFWPGIMWKYCQDNNIPSWSAEMLLDFVEARNSVCFENIAWETSPQEETSRLSFTFNAPLVRKDLTVMVPTEWSGRKLKSILANGKTTAVNRERIKGIEYGMFTISNARAHVEARYVKP